MAKGKKNYRDVSRPKIIAVAVFFALGWLALWGRAAWLQLHEGPRLAELATRQHLAAEFERGERGRIFDRNGVLLATSVEVKSVYARPLEVKNPEATAQRLASILGLPLKNVQKDMASQKNFVWVKRQIADREAAAMVQAGLPGIYLTTEFTRLYPNQHLAGQVLGFVGLDGQGLEGMERQYEGVLAGGQAQFVVMRDASGRRLYLDSQGREVDIRGRDLRLTLDANIQAAAEQALSRAVTQNGGVAGMAVVAEVRTGEILALANYPFFNPNIYQKSAPEIWRNRAALDIFEPGSTFKPFLFAAALERKTINPDKLYDCENGRWKVRNRQIRDTHPYAWLPAHKVLRYSSNIGCAKIGLELGVAPYHDALVRLGFGEKTGTGLAAESAGLLRKPGDWHEVELANISFGQGVSVTALQLVRGYLTLASGGMAKPLRLALEPKPEAPAPVQAVRKDAADKVVDILREVVEEDGTGVRARIPGVAVAGKTGTAQKPSPEGGYSDQYMSSFIGLVPADKPEFVVLTVVDSPKPQHYGGVVAAPAVQDVMVRTLAYFGKLPDAAAATAEAVEHKPAEGSSVMVEVVRPRPPDLDADNVPDLNGLPVRRAVEILMRKGITPVLKGSGAVVSGHRPQAGSPWPQGKEDVFVLYLS